MLFNFVVVVIYSWDYYEVYCIEGQPHRFPLNSAAKRKYNIEWGLNFHVYYRGRRSRGDGEHVHPLNFLRGRIGPPENLKKWTTTKCMANTD